MTTKKLDKRTKAYKKSQGLGDTIEKITEATGIKKAVKAIFGDDCGCDERKKILNKLFPYNKPECLDENEYNYLDEFFKHKYNTVTTEKQKGLLKISNRIFNRRSKFTTCGSCVRSMVNELKVIYNEYKDNQRV